MIIRVSKVLNNKDYYCRMGIYEGEELFICKHKIGPYLVKTKQTVFAIGRERFENDIEYIKIRGKGNEHRKHSI